MNINDQQKMDTFIMFNKKRFRQKNLTPKQNQLSAIYALINNEYGRHNTFSAFFEKNNVYEKNGLEKQVIPYLLILRIIIIIENLLKQQDK